jgi:hypothetical protein
VGAQGRLHARTTIATVSAWQHPFNTLIRCCGKGFSVRTSATKQCTQLATHHAQRHMSYGSVVPMNTFGPFPNKPLTTRVLQIQMCQNCEQMRVTYHAL